MRAGKPILISVLAMAAVVPAAGQDSGLSGLQQEDQRVASIAYRLLSANAPLCPAKVPLAGFAIHDLNQYAPAVRAEAARVFGLGDRPGVLAVVPNSPVARAGLRANGIITSISGVRIVSGRTKKASLDTVQSTEAILDGAMARPPVRIGRVGKPVISFVPETGCASRVLLVPGGKLNAFADGTTVQMSTALLNFAGNDDAVATVLSHELAHNVLQHRKVIKSKALTIKETETEADYWGMYFLVRAGFDGNRAIEFWDRYEAKTNKGILADGTHPGKKERLAFVRRVLADIREQQREDAPLVPIPMIFNTNLGARR